MHEKHKGPLDKALRDSSNHLNEKTHVKRKNVKKVFNLFFKLQTANVKIIKNPLQFTDQFHGFPLTYLLWLWFSLPFWIVVALLLHL